MAAVDSGRLAGPLARLAVLLQNGRDVFGKRGRRIARDVPALKDKLKAELSNAVNDANDNHWEEIAHWLVYEVRSS
jgi:hypothetical protein